MPTGTLIFLIFTNLLLAPLPNVSGLPINKFNGISRPDVRDILKKIAQDLVREERKIDALDSDGESSNDYDDDDQIVYGDYGGPDVVLLMTTQILNEARLSKELGPTRGQQPEPMPQGPDVLTKKKKPLGKIIRPKFPQTAPPDSLASSEKASSKDRATASIESTQTSVFQESQDGGTVGDSKLDSTVSPLPPTLVTYTKSPEETGTRETVTGKLDTITSDNMEPLDTFFTEKLSKDCFKLKEAFSDNPDDYLDEYDCLFNDYYQDFDVNKEVLRDEIFKALEEVEFYSRRMIRYWDEDGIEPIGLLRSPLASEIE